MSGWRVLLRWRSQRHEERDFSSIYTGAIASKSDAQVAIASKRTPP
ncbi:hypothetical protein NG799_24040 [Laspinema sp. D1]|uniref:Uncharacterized protein n=1 Tax=Laspinema palackyanum D2a TaxID=2953684 RepID=A0ABT2MZS1_9CYAN|nr:hypothetical protein [Laspinema sp. D2b]MCT7969391.1 hypothetical protein [Laspinema sp. D2a]